MPLGVFQVVNGYLTKQMMPSPQKIQGVAMWGGVVVTGVLFAVQPFGWLGENLGLKKKEEEH
eukprot:CAMPEP_0202856948 /NCGR_PEP_ID=MMETSP1391-20130828/57_1 /ASSEMBLY_ACC=CAM_ASM_000867 /TAXON_ID=1034604 /ORGANISM="Chlamydomonas leiostraca, Strain SAG 11-49" /LENGTH=61 /DNA_ID=CAMNT_0049535673 /DNA_START=80 /DNA_END=265 /DNA_ORIENTATION=+